MPATIYHYHKSMYRNVTSFIIEAAQSRDASIEPCATIYLQRRLNRYSARLYKWMIKYQVKQKL